MPEPCTTDFFRTSVEMEANFGRAAVHNSRNGMLCPVYQRNWLFKLQRECPGT